MRLAYSQDQWQGIALHTVGGEEDGAVAGLDFYARFYQRLEERGPEPDASAEQWQGQQQWIRQKQQLGKAIEQLLGDHGLKPGRGHRLLSLGAGLGIVEEILLNAGYEVDLQDCQSTSLRGYLTRYPETQAFIGDARSVGAPDASYDAVLCIALEYVFDKQEYLDLCQEMERLLKPGGYVVLVSVSNLTPRTIASMLYRRMRRLFSGRDASAKSVQWGYLRSLNEHLRTGRDVGLLARRCLGLDQHAEKLWERTPTLRDRFLAFVGSPLLLILFQKPLVDSMGNENAKAA